MRRRRVFLRFLLPSFFLVSIVVLVLGRQVLLARAQTAESTSTSCCGQPDETAPREVDFPYYSLREGFNSTLLLVSDWPKPLDFVVAFHTLTGQTILAPAMTIDPQQKLSIDLRTVLTGLGADVAGDFAEGSVSVYFNGAIMPLAGQLTVSNPERGLNMEVEMVDNAPGHGLLPKQLNGLWWGIGAGRDARVMVSNTSGNAVEADIFLDFAGERHAGAPLTFKPHETKILSISKLLGDLETSPASAPEGGITVIPRGAVPALIAQGKIMDVAKGFSTTLDFPLPEVQRTNALHATGVPIGLPSKDSPYAGTGVFIPHVIVRNMTSAPQSVVITLEYPGEKEPQQTPLAPLALGPYATEDLSLDSAFGLLPLPLPFCSIGIQYSGARGSVIAQVSSIEEKGDLVIDSRVANEGDGWAGSGGNPWHLDEETESILFLTNLSDRPAPIGFHVQAHGVHYYVDDLRLEPHETRAVDLRKLRDAQKPDFYKNKIPADATDGSVVWVRIGNVAVMGQMVVLQRHKGLASNYHCSMCQCGSYLLPWALVVTPSGATINVNSSRQFDATASYVDCYGNVYPQTGHQGFGWWPDPPGVAAVSANGYVTGVSGGTTTINALFIDCGKWQYDYFYDCCNCMYDNKPVGGTPLNVKALDHFNISVNSTPVSGETNSVVSGQSAQVKVEAIDNFGAVFTAYRGTAHFSSGDTVAALPANYTYTSPDNGAHTFSVTLKTVSLTSATRDLSVEDTVKGKKTTQNINVWFRVSMAIQFRINCDGDTQGSYIDGTACLPPNGPENQVFIGLPDDGSRVPCSTNIRVRNQSDGRLVQTSLKERGPGPLGRFYWNDGNVPTGLNSGDASDGLAIQLGQTFVNGGSPGANRFGCPYPIPNNPPQSAFGQANIFWRFGQ